MKWLVNILITITILFIFHFSVSAEMSPKEILAHADRARGNLEGIEWSIDMESIEMGRKQERTIMVQARGHNSLAEFISPPKVKGQKLLMIDRNMWFVKPGLSKPVPISPRQKLMGGAANGDIASTDYAGDYEPLSVSDESFNGELCYLLDLKAVNKKATYDQIQYWVSKERLVGVKADFFTVSGKRFKSAAFEYKNNIRIDGNTLPFISKMIITDAVIKENITTMSYGEVTIKQIPDSVFNLNLLMR
jgi:hypothetical protein